VLLALSNSFGSFCGKTYPEVFLEAWYLEKCNTPHFFIAALLLSNSILGFATKSYVFSYMNHYHNFEHNERGCNFKTRDLGLYVLERLCEEKHRNLVKPLFEGDVDRC
jgi:hypothetical protein